MPFAFHESPVPLFDRSRTVPPSRPRPCPPPRAAAVKGGRQAGALSRLALDGREHGGTRNHRRDGFLVLAECFPAVMTDLCRDRGNSRDVASLVVGQEWRGRPTERWQDKSREVRGRRWVGNGKTIRHFAQCASQRDSLQNQTRHLKITTRCTSRRAQ
jgi:hypothetical protein